MSQTSSIQGIRGMNDIYGQSSRAYHFVVNTISGVLQQYGYQPVELPLVEKSEVFHRSIGAGTDIVEKEMYSFTDRNDEQLTLRPEGTAGCVRAMIEHNLLYNQTQKVYYQGAMFRYERPQKGRYRQFHQIGAEAFGFSDPSVDAELIALSNRFLQALGLNNITLEINSIGDITARQNYRQQLLDFYQAHRNQLDEDALRRLDVNPLRNLDSKSPSMQALNAKAPRLIDHLDTESTEHFETLRTLLDGLGIDYHVNTNLVRGMDYYNRTVFEWVTTELGAQGTVCGGGRYDGLVELFGGKPTCGIGFGVGIERLMALVLQAQEVQQTADISTLDVCLITEAGVLGPALQISETLRNELTDLRIGMDNQCGSFKSQLKKADKSGAELALIYGTDEHTNDCLQVKYLRQSIDQQRIPTTQAVTLVQDYFASR